jgi:hypothetical protein
MPFFGPKNSFPALEDMTIKKNAFSTLVLQFSCQSKLIVRDRKSKNAKINYPYCTVTKVNFSLFLDIKKYRVDFVCSVYLGSSIMFLKKI